MRYVRRERALELLALPSTLPITEALPRLLAALDDHRNVVLEAPPGAGKSTGVPPALLDASWLKGRKILMLEPRRLAARAVATRMAVLRGEAVGQTIGYCTRLDSQVSAATRIEVVTEGILTRRLQRDQELAGVGLVIFDEFHERSLQADLGLALCLDVQDTLREDLRLLVMSATLDGEAVARLLGDAPRITSAGKAFPVETRYQSASAATDRDGDIVPAVARVTLRALDADPGDALVFLPGQREIRRTADMLAAGLPPAVDVHMLYGDLPANEQDAALRPAAPGRRKIVLATNIAETSLTIEGVRIVVDSGQVRRARFDPGSGMSRLDTLRISKASAEQRRGRAGRLASGICHRLWKESEHALREAQTPAEILEADLTPLALELAAWGVTSPSALRWLDPPPAASFARAQELLRELAALDTQDHITAHGREMAAMGTHPRLAHMLLKARALGAVGLASDIAALLGERDLVRTRDVDLRLRIDALRGSGPLPADAQIEHGARRRIAQTAAMLARQAGGTKEDRGTSVDELTGVLLALAYPDRIAQPRGDSTREGARYLLSGGRGAVLPPAQVLQQAEFLVVADLDAGEREARIRLAAPLQRSRLEATCHALIRQCSRIEWDTRTNAVIAREERWLGALLLEERPLQNPDREAMRAALLVGIRQLGIEALPWTPAARDLQARMLFAYRLEPAHWPDVGDASLMATLDDWLGPWLDGMTRREHLARLDIEAILKSRLDWPQSRRLEELAPTHLAVPSGSHIRIDYTAEGPVLAVRLQEVFGMTATPRIGGGKVPVTLHLLSPARRPVQVTRDLESFWARGYADVRKELKGRYPKHYWPEDPLSATATARAKPRGT